MKESGYRISLAKSKVTGIDSIPTPFEPIENAYSWGLNFPDAYQYGLHNMQSIIMGYDEKTAKRVHEDVKRRIAKAGIHENDTVVVMYYNNDRVRAIGVVGHDIWLDAMDLFRSKSFNELEIDPVHLEVY